MIRTLVLSICAALFSGALVRAEHILTKYEVFREDRVAAILDSASEIEACILRVKDPSNGKDLSKRTFVEGRYKALPKEVGDLILWKLLDEKSYTLDGVSGCVPTYNA
jgi:hypothetical protein